jgi:Cft2 family RNA processing exonuclease
MKIMFYGAVREVIDSMHLLTTDTNRILLDCGMFQDIVLAAFGMCESGRVLHHLKARVETWRL